MHLLIRLKKACGMHVNWQDGQVLYWVHTEGGACLASGPFICVLILLSYLLAASLSSSHFHRQPVAPNKHDGAMKVACNAMPAKQHQRLGREQSAWH